MLTMSNRKRKRLKEKNGLCEKGLLVKEESLQFHKLF